MGATEEASNKCVVDCIEEFDAIADANLIDPLSLRMFQRGGSLRAQALLYAQSPPNTSSLIDFPALFVEVQEAAAAKVDETPVEQLHTRIHNVLQHA